MNNRWLNFIRKELARYTEKINNTEDLREKVFALDMKVSLLEIYVAMLQEVANDGNLCK